MSLRNLDGSATRARNAHLVLSAMRRLGRATLSEIASVTRLSRPTIKSIVGRFVDSGLLREDDPIADGGRPAAVFRFDEHRQGCVLAVELQASHLAVAVVRASGQVVHTADHPVTQRGTEERFDEVVTLLRAALETVPPGPVHAVLVAATGVVGEDGRHGTNFYVPEWQDFPLATRLAEALDTPVRVENDVNIAAMGEYYFRLSTGDAEPGETMLFVRHSEEFQTGLVVDGRIHRGHTGRAGEVNEVLDGARIAGLMAAYPQPDSLEMVLALIIGAFGAIVDPHLIVLHDLCGTGSNLASQIVRLQNPDAPAPRVSESILTGRAAMVGSVLTALSDGDTALVGYAPQRPWLPQNLHHITNPNGS